MQKASVKPGKDENTVPLLPANTSTLNTTDEIEMKRPAIYVQDHVADVRIAAATPFPVNSTPDISPVHPPRPRYLTRSSKARLAAEQVSKQYATSTSALPGATGQVRVASPARKYCRMCGIWVSTSQFKAPCGHELCRNCVGNGVRRCLDMAQSGAGVPVSCCDKALPLNLICQIISERELLKYAKLKTKHTQHGETTMGVATRGTKRKAAPEKKSNPTTRGKTPAKRADNQSQENEHVCASCFSQVTSPGKWQIGPCGHGYCLPCFTKLAKTSLTNRDQVPIRCCSKEFPVEYVERALTKTQFDQYTHFLAERDPNASTLQSDRDYAAVVCRTKGKQCPVCWIGVVKVSGCNAIQCSLGHLFCWKCLRTNCTCGRVYMHN